MPLIVNYTEILLFFVMFHTKRAPYQVRQIFMRYRRALCRAKDIYRRNGS